MSERLVVCLRYAAIESESQHYLGVARRVEAALSAVGGERISWGADRYAFELDPDDFPLVLRQLIATQLELPEHGVGIGIGQLVGQTEAMAWGRPLVVASALASSAKPGEILLDPQLPDVRHSRLATLGRIPVRIGERYVGAALLLPGACPATGFRVEESEPPSTSSGLPESQRAAPRGPESLRTPESLRSPESRLPPASLGPGRPSVFDALRSGDPSVMLDLAKNLRVEQPDNLAASRLEAMALIAQGKADEGLRLLQRFLESVSTGPALLRSQAGLALAVGHARVGNSRKAALCALTALSDAEECNNTRAAQACSQLLAQLAANDGATEVAQSWQRRSVQTNE
jgi:hypothetical protein